MNIIVVVRTRDEAHRIGKFCEAYKDANKIIVADGGSVDNTVQIAKSYSNVELHHYTKRVKLQRGYWRNNDSDHANFLFGLAYSLSPDWVIFDDCDIRPNYLLKQDYIKILKETDKDVVMAVRVYLWEKDQYFPMLSSPLGERLGQPSLWAWRGNLDLWTVDAFPHFSLRIGGKKVEDFRKSVKTLELFYPYCLLHYSWITPELANAKVEYHHKSGLTPNMLHPTQFGGDLKPLEEWMQE